MYQGRRDPAGRDRRELDTVGGSSFLTSGDRVGLERYLQTLRVSEGGRAGRKLRLLGWQRKFVRGAFAPGVTQAVLSIARGNGKTTLAAGLAVAAISGPLASEGRSEVLCVASSFQQSRILFSHALAFLRPTIAAAPEDWRVNDNANRAIAEHRPSGRVLRCIASDPRRAHGHAPVLILADEPAQWPRSTSDEMYAVLSTSLGKLPGARLLVLGTQPPADAIGATWFARLLRGDQAGSYVQIHAAEKDANPWAVKAWQQANPSLRRVIETEAQNARLDPMIEPPFRALRLNQAVASVSIENLVLSAARWRDVERDAPRTGGYVLGVDLGGGASMDAVAAYWPDTGAVDSVGAFGSEPNLAARGRRDHVGDLYGRMAALDELVTLGNRIVPPASLLALAHDRWGVPTSIVADRYKEAALRDALAGYRAFDRSVLLMRGMGWRDGSEDLSLFRGEVLEARLSAPESLLLRSALAEARTVMDQSANIKLVRSKAAHGRRFRAKDDALAALVLAVAEGVRMRRCPPRRGPRIVAIAGGRQ